MIFVGICSALVLACVGALYLTLRKIPDAEDTLAARSLYSQRLSELREDLASGEMLADQAEAAEDDLVRVTLDDEKQLNHREGKNARALPSLLAIFLVIAGISGASYWHLGDLDRALGRTPTTAEDLPLDEAAIEQAIANLKQRLETHPDSAEGWALLGRTMMAMGNYPEALTALKKANELVPDAPGLMLQYADALAMNAGGELTDEAQQLVSRVLEIDPDNIAALWLAGLGAAERDDKPQAIAYLRRARELSVAAGASTTELDQVLQRLGSAERGSDTPGAKKLPPIPILVALDAKYAERLSGDETLFVFARVEGQAGPPVAVRRENNVSFPHRTSLDASMSMAPQFRLAAGQSISIVARLSKSGNAMPEVGDLVGRAAAFNYPDDTPGDDEPLTVTIDTTQH